MTLSAADVKYELDNLRPNLFLDETEDTWEKIAKSIASLTRLCENGGYDANPSELVAALRSAHRPIVGAMNSERTRLSLIPLDLISTLASVMGGDFEQLLQLFMQPLLTLCTRTNKVVLNRARACIFTVIECSQSTSLLTYFLQSIKDKSTTLKTVSSEGTLACLNSCNPPDLEKESRAMEIEAIIRATARDASADVRKVSRKLYEAYKILLPSRVSNFTAPLSPTTKKYLDVKPVAVNPSLPSNARSIGQIKPQTKTDVKLAKPSTSTSTTSAVSKPTAGRVVSSSLSTTTTMSNQARKPATTMTRVARKEPTDAPAAYAPVRPAPPLRVTSDVPKTSTSRQAISIAGPTRSTSAEDNKRPAVASRSTVTRTAGAPSSMGANRMQLNSAAAVATASSTVSGPRRVPMPVPAAAPAPAPVLAKESTKTSTSRPGISATGSFRPRPASVTSAPIKPKSSAAPISTKPITAKVNPRPVPSAASVATVSGSASGSTTTRPLAVSKAKPQWGSRSAAPPAKPANAVQKPTAASMLARKPSSRVLPRAAAPTQRKGVIPAMVALPPSPTPDCNDAEDKVIPASSTKAEQPIQEEKAIETPIYHEVETTTAHPQIAILEDQGIEKPVYTTESTDSNVPVASEDVSEHSEEEIAATEPHTEDVTSSTPSTVPQVPQTPHGLLPLPLQPTFATKTPISALLSSIEHGFTYSPNSPLSPAELYLDNGATPYTHQARPQGPRQPFNYALHAPDGNGVFSGFSFGHTKKEEELVCGDIGVIKISDHNKLFSQMGMDDGTRHAFLELNH